MKRQGELSLGDALKAYMHKGPLRNQMNKVRIQEVWKKVMGKTIAKYTRSLKVKNRKLIIATDIAPLKQELSYSKELIIKRINEALGENLIDEVIIR